MKLTVRIPTGILAQVLNEALGMDTPITGDEPITVEWSMKARELPAYAKAVGEVAQTFEEMFPDEPVDEPDDGTSPHTVPMDAPAEAEAA